MAAAFSIVAPAAPFLSAMYHLVDISSINFTAHRYAESLFALLASSGMIAFHKHQRLCAALFWSLASLTRSNGILLCGFFIYELLELAIQRRLKVR